MRDSQHPEAGFLTFPDTEWRGLGVSAERVTDTYDSLVRAAAAEAVTAV